MKLMNSMLRRLTLASAVIAMSTLSIAQANAQIAGNTTVPFNAVVQKECLFPALPLPGTAVPARIDPTTLPSWLEASRFGGGNGSTLGTTSVACNSAATITVADPTRTAGPSLPANTKYSALVTSTSSGTPTSSTTAASPTLFDTGAWAYNPSFTIAAPTGSNSTTTPLYVLLAVGNQASTASALIPGSYTFNVVVTATPQ